MITCGNTERVNDVMSLDVVLGDDFVDHDAESCVMLLASEHLVSNPHEGDTNVFPCHFGENKSLNRKNQEIPEL